MGDSNFKFFARSDKYKYLGYGTAAYGFMVWLLIYLLKHSNVIYMNSMWDSISIVMEALLAYFLLGEKLSNKYQYAGMFMIVGGISLLNVGKIPY